MNSDWKNYGHKEIEKERLKLGLFKRHKVIFLILTLLIAVLLFQNVFAVSDTNLLAYYNLDSNSGGYAWDKAGNDDNATISGSTTSIPIGKIGNAYSGASTWKATASAATKFNFTKTDTFSICGWIKTTNASGEQYLASNSNSTTGWILELDSGYPEVVLSTSWSTNAWRIKGNTLATTGNYTYICGVYDGNVDGRLYVNGSQATISTTTATLSTNPNYTGYSPTLSGRYSDTYARVDGNLDEVSIWARALSTQDVADLYNSGTGTTYCGTTGYTSQFASTCTPVSATPQARITWNVYRTGTSTHLTDVNADCNVNAMDFSSQNSPVTGTYVDQNTSVSCTFTRAGYDANANYFVVVDSNKTVTVYLSDSTAPSVGATGVSGFTTYGTYINGTGTISATATDSGSGITSCEYTTDNGSTWASADLNATHCYKSSITINEDRNYQFNLRATDTAGNTGTGTATIQYQTDLTAPLTLFSYAQIANSSDANIFLECTDAKIGCKEIYWNVNNSTWSSATQSNLTDNNTYTPNDSSSFTVQTTPTLIQTLTFNEDTNNQFNSITTTAQCQTPGLNNGEPYMYLRVFNSDGTQYDSNIFTCSGAGGCSVTGDINFLHTDFNKIEVYYWEAASSYCTQGGALHSGIVNTTIDFNYFYSLNQRPYNVIYSAATEDNNIEYYSLDYLDNNEGVKTNSFTVTPDTSPPVLTWSLSKNYGFTNDFNLGITMTCTDDRTNDLQYVILLNDTNYLLNSSFAPGTSETIYQTLILKEPATFDFNCTDLWGNSTLDTSNTIYPLIFNLVNEDTGETFTVDDLNTNFTSAIAYSIDGNYQFDFNSPVATTSATLLAPQNLILFAFTYKGTNPIVLTRQIDFSLIPDLNIPVCVPEAQTLYPQAFVSNQQRKIVLKSNVAQCYVLAGALQYALDTGYSFTTYTIPKQYYLYSVVDDVTSYLALIEGSTVDPNNIYNLDTLLFSRQQVSYTLGQDGVAFAPLSTDSNILQIYYKSFYGSNKSVQMIISYDDANVFTTTETVTPNDFITNFNFGLVPGLTDENYLTLTLNVTYTDNSKKTFVYYFNPKGNYRTTNEDYAWAAIISMVFFIGGITTASSRTIIGLFGILVCIISMALCALALSVWWVSILEIVYLMTLFYILILYKPSQSLYGYGGGII